MRLAMLAAFALTRPVASSSPGDGTRDGNIVLVRQTLRCTQRRVYGRAVHVIRKVIKPSKRPRLA